MRRLAGRKFEIALLLGLGCVAPLLAADPDDGDQPKGWHLAPWLQKELDDDNPPPKPKPKKPAAKPEPAKPAPPVADHRLITREQAEKDFLRRLAVCDRLAKIAQETQDAQLERQVAQLSDRAWAVYRQHVARLPVPSDKPESDAKIVQEYLREGPDRSKIKMQNSPTSHLSGIENDTEFLLNGKVE